MVFVGVLPKGLLHDLFNLFDKIMLIMNRYFGCYLPNTASGRVTSSEPIHDQGTEVSINKKENMNCFLH